MTRRPLLAALVSGIPVVSIIVRYNLLQIGLPLLLAAFGLIRWRMREASRATVTV